jgi:hypothetical protein
MKRPRSKGNRTEDAVAAMFASLGLTIAALRREA